MLPIVQADFCQSIISRYTVFAHLLGPEAELLLLEHPLPAQGDNALPGPVNQVNRLVHLQNCIEQNTIFNLRLTLQWVWQVAAGPSLPLRAALSTQTMVQRRLALRREENRMALDKPATAALLRDAVRFASDLMGGAPALWAQEHRAKDNVPPADAAQSLLRLSLARVFSPETVAAELAHAPVFPSAQPAAQNAVASLPQSNLQSGTRWEPVQTKPAATPRTPSEEAADLPQQPKLPGRIVTDSAMASPAAMIHPDRAAQEATTVGPQHGFIKPRPSQEVKPVTPATTRQGKTALPLSADRRTAARDASSAPPEAGRGPSQGRPKQPTSETPVPSQAQPVQRASSSLEDRPEHAQNGPPPLSRPSGIAQAAPYGVPVVEPAPNAAPGAYRDAESALLSAFAPALPDRPQTPLEFAQEISRGAMPLPASETPADLLLKAQPEAPVSQKSEPRAESLLQKPSEGRRQTPAAAAPAAVPSQTPPLSRSAAQNAAEANARSPRADRAAASAAPPKSAQAGAQMAANPAAPSPTPAAMRAAHLARALWRPGASAYGRAADGSLPAAWESILTAHTALQYAQPSPIGETAPHAGRLFAARRQNPALPAGESDTAAQRRAHTPSSTGRPDVAALPAASPISLNLRPAQSLSAEPAARLAAEPEQIGMRRASLTGRPDAAVLPAVSPISMSLRPDQPLSADDSAARFAAEPEQGRMRRTSLSDRPDAAAPPIASPVSMNLRPVQPLSAGEPAAPPAAAPARRSPATSSLPGVPDAEAPIAPWTGADLRHAQRPFPGAASAFLIGDSKAPQISGGRPAPFAAKTFGGPLPLATPPFGPAELVIQNRGALPAAAQSPQLSEGKGAARNGVQNGAPNIGMPGGKAGDASASDRAGYTPAETLYRSVAQQAGQSPPAQPEQPAEIPTVRRVVHRTDTVEEHLEGRLAVNAPAPLMQPAASRRPGEWAAAELPTQYVVDQLADRVYQALKNRLRTENLRKGVW